ncbi:phycocyanin alpha phycocyanobilin lyase [Neosynechococcus sphagnicola sy1]|uniref:Phycocyanin alpha phycocyanobilin lyase n=1 Tax=Neosynechococcus sphagnicola sy1 TaxID=1497020 RepID=A0A098TKZ0_9CYAN|nr:HEAT repeat domain-containing protein [Neosynechococcus sphagnicola]KGF72990.1 phycocyanin alpha phycocyanobilin lyase [Neosynechococcus sphagnicola sy1]
MNPTPESVQQLLQSEDLGDRLRGVNHLRTLEPHQAFELIQTAIADANPRVRYAALSQMATLGSQDRGRSQTILRDRLLNEREMDVQAAAADAISALHLTELFEDLEAVYNSTPEWLLKFSIVAALGELGDLRALPLLEDALDSGTDLLQIAAIGSLGELGDQRAVPLLIPYAAHTDWQIRYRVVQAFQRLGGPDTLGTLAQLASDAVEQIANEAQAALEANR